MEVFMYKRRWLFLVLIFVLALATACGGGASPDPAPAPAEEAQPVEAEEPAGVTTDFPLPEDAMNLMEVGENTFNFQTELSIPDVVTFYRFAFPDYTEREILTVVTDASLNLVFDGHASGKTIVIQGFPMGDGTVNVSIRLEAID